LVTGQLPAAADLYKTQRQTNVHTRPSDEINGLQELITTTKGMSVWGPLSPLESHLYHGVLFIPGRVINSDAYVQAAITPEQQ